VLFECRTGGPSPRLIHKHTFVSGIPDAGRENARINLWLLGGRAPKDGRDVEVVISSFNFTPYR
jgi:hypothetical protein